MKRFGHRERDALGVIAAGGIGTAICRRYVNDGAQVSIADTNLGAGEIFATEIRNAGGLAKTYAIDLADPKAIKSFVAF